MVLVITVLGVYVMPFHQGENNAKSARVYHIKLICTRTVKALVPVQVRTQPADTLYTLTQQLGQLTSGCAIMSTGHSQR